MADPGDRTRLWLEGVVIVVSILLAFGIEAAWAEFLTSREARGLLQSIRADVVATEAEVARQRVGSEELAARARTLLLALAADGSPEEQREALLTLGSIFVTGGWSPVNHTNVEARRWPAAASSGTCSPFDSRSNSRCRVGSIGWRI